MYVKRNSITIALLVALVLICGFIWHSRETKILKEVTLKNKELAKQFAGSRQVAQTLETVEKKYDILKEAWDQAPKKILSAEEPALTVSYINWLTNENRISFDFDFILDNISKNQEISFFSFTLTGDATYYDIYQFIWYLTQNPLLYQIEDFSLQRKEENSNVLSFKVKATGYFMDQELEMKHGFDFESIKSVSKSTQFHDVFKSTIQKPKPRIAKTVFYKSTKPIVNKVNKDLLDVNTISLQALANGRAYILTQDKKMKTLQVGDKVRSGSLIAIDKEKSEAVFSVRINGFDKRITLGLGYKK